MAITIGLLFVFYTFSLSETATNDAYWHIKMGQRFVEAPFDSRDVFSFTHKGKEISQYPYVFEVGLYYLDKYLDYDKASQVFLYSGYILGLLLTVIYANKTQKNFVIVLFAIGGFSYFYSQRLMVRPDVLYFPLLIIALYLYRIASQQFNIKSYLCLLVLTFAWSNYYSAVFLYVIFGGLYLDLAVKYWRENKNLQKWILLVFSGAVLLATEFITPFGQHSLLGQVNFESRWKTHIVEYWSIFDRYLTTYHFIPLVLFVVLAIGLSVKTRSAGYLLIILVFVVASIQMNRVLPFAGFVMVLLIVDMMKDYRPRSVSVFALVLASLFLGLIAAKFYLNDNDNKIQEQHRKPAELVSYFKKRGYKGNIFNDYNLGGYLIYQLYPDSKVYIDGRTHILYDYDFFEHYLAVMSDEKYINEIDKLYGLDFLIIRNNPDFFLTAYHTGKFQMDFLDNKYALFKKNKANLSITGLILAAPYCWKDSYGKKVIAELSNLEKKWLNKDLVELKSVIQESKKSDNRYSGLNSKIAEYGDISKRFIGYQLFFKEEFQQTIETFLSVKEMKLRDYLVVGISAVNQGNYKLAKEVIHTVIKNNNMRFDDVDVILLSILTSMVKDTIQLNQDMIEFDKAVKRDIVNRDMSRYLSLAWSDLLCNPELSMSGRYLNALSIKM